MYKFSYLVEINGPDNHPDVSFYNGCIYSKDFSELIYYPAAKEYSEDLLHENVVKFGDYSFSQHEKLKDVVIPLNVTDLGIWAFYMTTMTSLEVHKNVKTIGSQCFSWSKNLTSAKLHTPNLTGIDIFTTCGVLKDITISEFTTVIPNGFVSSCPLITEFEIPDSVISLGSNSFNNCSGLTSLIIPEKVTSIGDSCFLGCTNLGDITCLPTKAPSLGKEVFGNSNLNYTGVKAVNKIISVPAKESGYELGDWKVILSDKIGFTFNYTL